MSLATALLTPILGDASPWTPRRLFQLGEAGGVYDPSDLTAEKVAWRRNLLTWSEDFTNAAWTNTAFTITANAAVAPDGTTTADALVPTTSNTFHRVFQNATRAGRVMSAFVRANGYNKVALKESGTTGFHASFDLSTVAVLDASAGVAASIVADVGGWYRIVAVLPQQVATIGVQVNVLAPGYTSGDPNSSTFAGDGTSGIFSWGAQADVSALTAYQRITDFTSDFLAAFPTHGLYQDAAGTTPVTALGQPVGLVIDSKTGGLANLGAEQLSNNEFTSNVTGWSAAGSATVTWDSSGAALVDITGAGGGIQDTQTLALTVGRTYRVVASVRAGTYASQLALQANNVTIATITPTATYQTVTAYFTAPSADPPIALLRNLAATGTIFVDFLSVREVPGVHAIQPTNSSRPLLDGRVNLLERTEQFDNAAWNKTFGGVGLAGVVTANAGVAPDGTSTADRVQLDCGNAGSASNRSQVIQNFTAVSGGGYKTALYIKAWDSGNIGKTVRVNSDAIGGGVYTLTADWQLVGVTGTASGTSSNFNIETRGTFTTQTADLLVWGADLRLAADAAYPYQRVAAATDYADVGVPRSFAFDGFDDSLYTASNMDLSGTDKVTVLAGVRKLSDAALGIVAEHTASLNANNGSFWLMNGDGTVAAGPIWQYASKGTVNAFATSPSSYASPVTSVLAGLSNIAGDSVLLRVNGAQVASAATDQGTGNYANAVFYIGRRGNTSLPFNGKAYQLIVRGALTDAATLAQAQRYVGAKTGLYI